MNTDEKPKHELETEELEQEQVSVPQVDEREGDNNEEKKVKKKKKKKKEMAVKLAPSDEEKLPKKNKNSFGRGTDTMYRTTYRSHINLSSIADGKANMMISINTIILSGIITLVGSVYTFSEATMDGNSAFVAPLIVLLLTSLVSIIIAVISARPTVTHQTSVDYDPRELERSLLFFGNFVDLKPKSFLEKLHILHDNQELTYDHMGLDIYWLGKVLQRKYQLVRLSYNVFMMGLIISVGVFLVVLLLKSQVSGA